MHGVTVPIRPPLSARFSIMLELCLTKTETLNVKMLWKLVSNSWSFHPRESTHLFAWMNPWPLGQSGIEFSLTFFPTKFRKSPHQHSPEWIFLATTLLLHFYKQYSNHLWKGKTEKLIGTFFRFMNWDKVSRV